MEDHLNPETLKPEENPAQEQTNPESIPPEENAPQPEKTEQPAPETTRGAGNGDMDSIRTLAQELASIMTAAAQPPLPPQPTEEQKKKEAQEAKRARKLKARRRRRKAFKSRLIRTLVLIVVIYVLFFQIIGITKMPNGDMYPRIDSGDVLLFYRLEKSDIKAQDIIVFDKDRSALQEYVDRTAEDKEETEKPDETTEETQAPAPTETAKPGNETNTVYVPDSVQSLTPAQIVNDDSFLGKVNRFLYNAEEFLGLRRPDGKQTFVCRVVAVAGDTVEITEEGGLLINGNHVVESNIFSHTTPYVGFTEYPLTLHAGELFVMADQRDGGADSRFFGVVHSDEVLGTVITILRRNNL